MQEIENYILEYLYIFTIRFPCAMFNGYLVCGRGRIITSFNIYASL